MVDIHPIHAFIRKFHLEMECVFADVVLLKRGGPIYLYKSMVNLEFVCSIAGLLRCIFEQVPVDELVVGKCEDFLVKDYLEVLRQWCWDWEHACGYVTTHYSEVL